MAEHIMVAFAGEGSGTDELTWGQQAIWAEIKYTGVSLSMGGVMALPAGTSIDEVAAVLAFAMSRHQSLRTRLRFEPSGRVRQEVFADGEVALDIVEAAGRDPAEAAERLRAHWLATNFDYEHEWPVRMAVVRHQGALTHVVVTYCHMAFDAHGFLAMTADLEQLDRATGKAQSPVTGVPPLEQARRQRGASARRQSETALRYWERLLRAAPARRFRDSTDRRSPRFWEASYTSLAMRLAVRRIVADHKVDAAPVLLAAFAITLARVTGINPVVTQVLVSNRFRPHFVDTVSPVMQSGLCVIDVADITFREAVDRAWQSSMGTYLHAYYDPAQRDELVSSISLDRGENVDISCFYNDRRRPVEAGPDRCTPTPPDPVPTAAEILAARTNSRLDWLVEMDRVNRTLFFHVDEAPDGLYVLMVVDTHFVSPADLEACLRGVEEVLVDAAVNPAVQTVP
jgi:hypothetical protein